ncbi:MAG: tetratricopeptide repeat protein, partial [Shewanella sp.]|uniref:tetratricopeptide repeat protein n=1 Tax=Shewanella sp. TaxID=50422 RepID=UPI003F2A4EA3
EYSAAPTTAAVDARAIATKNAVASSPALVTSSGVSAAAATPVATPEPSAAVVSANSAMVNTNTAMVSANTALESAASSAAVNSLGAANVSGAVNTANTASAAYPQAERAMTVTEVSLTPPQLAQKQLALAKAAEGQGELRQAINHYQQALTLTPGLHAARKQQAALLYGQEQWSQASAVLAQGILLYPQEFEFALLLARVQQAKGDGVEALASLELIPDDHELARQKWLAQTDLAQKQGQFALAEQAYRKLLQQEPRQGKWWMGLAYALDSQQQYHHARQAYRTALTHAGLSSQATAFIEQRLTQLGDSQ